MGAGGFSSCVESGMGTHTCPRGPNCSPEPGSLQTGPGPLVSHQACRGRGKGRWLSIFPSEPSWYNSFLFRMMYSCPLSLSLF